ncbi:hypothetical protein [Dactylosporangium matsuzakiense]|uniref:Uncharacterized protein n=1 Tax=Dactylosporangium matsuzakiense TaxID=53360 RepID=A0A9W6KQP6_9ACTN|nr:hypothetical protein [Dactylosporangium matsuzakiense]GLL03774.1 hypothetical protein GCM10017581_055200 [Dactylosporangium matsuzakiense]
MANEVPDICDRRAFAAQLTVLERAGLTIRAGVPAATVGGYFGGSHLPPLRQPSVHHYADNGASLLSINRIDVH